VPDSAENRLKKRKAVGLLVKLGHQGVEEFVEKYATNMSEGGMFLRTKTPQPIGTELQFKIEIAGGQRVMQGSAVVKWVRAVAKSPAEPAGMGVEFLNLDTASQQIVMRMMALTGDAPPPAPTGDEPLDLPPLPNPDDVDIPLDALLSGTPPPPPDVPPPSLFDPFELPIAMEAPAPLDADSFSLEPPAPPDHELHVPESPPAALQQLPVAAPTMRKKPATLPPGKAPAANAPVPSVAPAVPKAAPAKPPPPAAKAEPPKPALSAPKPAPAPGPAAAKPAPAPAPAKPAAPAPKPAPAPPPAAAKPAPAPAAPKPAAAPPPKPPAPAAAVDDIPLDDLTDEAVQEPPTLMPADAKPAEPQASPTSHMASAPALVFLKPPAKIETTGPVIGIDLGTTNSCCAILHNGKPLILRSKDGYNTIPSVVALSNQGKLLVGHRARSQMLLKPEQSIYGAKRLVGRDFDSATVRQVKELFHYEIIPGGDGRAAVKLGANTLSLEEVQGIVLQECREMAESHLNTKVSRAVITCPAYYSETQREAVRRAAAMAGLKVERILNEPTAAALAYGMNRQLAKTVLVYDLGGGTFDATLMSIEGNVFEVLATGGDIFLGGVDFDNQVVDLMLKKYRDQHGSEFLGDSIALSRINDAAERAKIALSERTSYDVHLPMLEMTQEGTPRDLKCTITRPELEKACADLVARTISHVQDVLLDAKLKPSEVDEVVLAGGMSRMPLVRKQLEALFKKPPHASVNADEAVALGAALYSGTVDKVSSVVLIDVVPMTIGVGMPGGVFRRIIERNTPLPVSKAFGVSTQSDNQQQMELMIFQGEDKHVSANEFLGAVHVEGLPKGPKGSVQVAVTLSLDSECVLSVEARELRTRKAFRAKLATRFTSDEIAKRLGIEKASAKAVEAKRAQELEVRAGGFWNKVKKVFGQ
jgi:uncharacterized protein (TIGR02266 family)